MNSRVNSRPVRMPNQDTIIATGMICTNRAAVLGSCERGKYAPVEATTKYR
jgi:hypothetical protein